MMTQLTIKKLEETAEELRSLKDICEKWNFWTYPELITSLQHKQYHCFYSHHTTIPNKWVAIIVFSCILKTTDIIYIYVDKKYRKRGYALSFLFYLEKKLKSDYQQNKIMLEVDESSNHAIKLYQKFGMTQISIRKKYYKNNNNALIFHKEI